MFAPRASADVAFLSVVRDFDDCASSLATNPFRHLTDFGTHLRASLVARGVAVGPPLLAPYTIERPCPGSRQSCAECDRWSRARNHKKIWQRWLPEYKADFDRVYAACVGNNRTVCGATPGTTLC